MHKIFKSFFNKINKKLTVFIAVASFMLAILGTGVITHVTIKNQMQAEVILLETGLNHEKELKEEALAQLETVVKIRNSYRENLKQIVELLYNKDTHLGVGGSNFPVESSDEAILLQMQTIISSMDDDLQLMSQVRQYLQARSEFINSFPFVWPVKGGVPDISSDYGFRYNPFGEIGPLQYHPGIDIPGEKNQEIVSTADGQVVSIWSNDYSSGEHLEYGMFIIIQHRYEFQTYYGHLDSINVRWGQEVKKGDVIGFMGNSGRSTGYHLHYEIRHNGVPMNPMTYLAISY